MAGRGVEAVVTSETDPLTAVQSYLSGNLPSAPEQPAEDAANDACYGKRLRSQRTSRRTHGRQSRCADPKP